jgi:hypothetical protein
LADAYIRVFLGAERNADGSYTRLKQGGLCPTRIETDIKKFITHCKVIYENKGVCIPGLGARRGWRYVPGVAKWGGARKCNFKGGKPVEGHNITEKWIHPDAEENLNAKLEIFEEGDGDAPANAVEHAQLGINAELDEVEAAVRGQENAVGVLGELQERANEEIAREQEEMHGEHGAPVGPVEGAAGDGVVDSEMKEAGEAEENDGNGGGTVAAPVSTQPRRFGARSTQGLTGRYDDYITA